MVNSNLNPGAVEELELSRSSRPSLHLPEPVTAIAWSNAFQLLAVAFDWGRRIRIFDSMGEVRQEFQGRYSSPASPVLFLDGKQILVTAATDENSASTDAALSLWDTEGGHLLGHIPGPFPRSTWVDNRAYAFAASADGRVLAALSGAVRVNNEFLLYDVARNERLDEGDAASFLPARYHSMSIDLSSDGQSVAFGVSTSQIFVFDVGVRRRPKLSITAFTSEMSPGVEAVKFNPLGTLIAAGAGLISRPGPGALGLLPPPPSGSEIAGTPGQPHFVGIWDAQTGKLRTSLPGPRELAPIRQLAWSKDGRSLAIAAGDGSVRVWMPEAALREKQFAARLGTPAGAVAFIQDDQFLAASADNEVRFFRTNQG